jgi:membrane protein YqaA with SNARE-associated domain
MDSMGIPLPAVIDVLILGVAATSASAPQRAYLTALMAVVGSTAGNVTLFQAAYHGRKLFSSNKPPNARSQKFQAWFYRYGLLTVFVPAVTPVIPLPLKVFVISAGALHTSFSRFLAIILLARVLRYLEYMGATALGKSGQNGDG